VLQSMLSATLEVTKVTMTTNSRNPGQDTPVATENGEKVKLIYCLLAYLEMGHGYVPTAYMSLTHTDLFAMLDSRAMFLSC
jgi:hypothetical protein